MTWRGFRRLFRANLRRAVIISAIVGTVLILINHGDHLEHEPVCSNFYLKCVLCYLVPFTVSIVSAMLAAGRGRGATSSTTPSGR